MVVIQVEVFVSTPVCFRAEVELAFIVPALECRLVYS